MAKIGRPEKAQQDARSLHVAVRVTAAERLALLERAAAAGFPSVSDFVRSAALSRRLPPRPAPPSGGVLNADDRRALSNIGNNLNQIARVSHGGRPHAMITELRRSLAQLDALLDRYLPE